MNDAVDFSVLVIFSVAAVVSSALLLSIPGAVGVVISVDWIVFVAGKAGLVVQVVQSIKK